MPPSMQIYEIFHQFYCLSGKNLKRDDYNQHHTIPQHVTQSEHRNITLTLHSKYVQD